MAGNTIGSMPEFTTDEVAPEGTAPSAVEPEVVSAPVETPALEPSKGTESPAEPPPAPETLSTTDEKIVGLEREKAKLLDEIKSLRVTRRELKQEQIARVEQKIDDLADLNPSDVSVVERILRGKGYVTRAEAQAMSYQSVKQEQLDRFLEKYPEYKPENDPLNIHWDSFQRELGYYIEPKDPHKIGEVLERAHKAVARPQSTDTNASRQRVAIASHGAGGSQRSSPTPQGRQLTDVQKNEFRRGGWSEEEIKSMEIQ